MWGFEAPNSPFAKYVVFAVLQNGQRGCEKVFLVPFPGDPQEAIEEFYSLLDCAKQYQHAWQKIAIWSRGKNSEIQTALRPTEGWV